MKRQIVFTILFFITAILTAEDVQLRKIAQFHNDPNNNETISIRSDVGDDDISGNTMLISSEGKILIHCRDKNEVFYFDSGDEKLHPLFDTKFLPAPNFAYFNQITKSHYFFFGNNGNFYLVDKDFNLTANINFLYNWDVRTYFDAALYDEDSDTLFFLDNDKDIHSITHPSLDENINQKNYRDSSETMQKLGNDEYAPHLTLDKKRNLYINGVRYRWDTLRYQIKNYNVLLVPDAFHINVYDGNKRQFLNYTIPENEEVESISYHPNGDWYFLTINWTTNIHTLWRIENTWDSKWREQWNRK